jgi:hypothetical protein
MDICATNEKTYDLFKQYLTRSLFYGATHNKVH